MGCCYAPVVKKVQTPSKSNNTEITEGKPKQEHLQPQRPRMESNASSANRSNLELLLGNHQNFVMQGKFFQHYTLLGNIKKGCKEKIFRVQHNQTGQHRTVRIMNLSSAAKRDKLVENVMVLKKLDHPNLARIYEFYNEKNFQYLVVEELTGKNIIETISNTIEPKENQYHYIFCQMLSALAYLHKNHIIHQYQLVINLFFQLRNISPESCIFASGKEDLMKFSEYGLEINLETDDISYQAPEVFKGEVQTKSDIWSCGVFFYLLLTGYHPFKGKDHEQTIKQIKRGIMKVGQEWEQVDPDAKKLIQLMVRQNPASRPTALECLNFAYIKQLKLRYQTYIPNQIIIRLKQFKIKSQLQRILLTYMVDRMIDKDERDILAKAFLKMDRNGDGRISRDEFLSEMLQNGEKSQQEAELLFKLLDADQNNNVEFSEFLVASCDHKKLLKKENIREFFKQIDKDHSQSITVKELQQLFYNTSLSQQDWRDLMKDADQDKDQRISFDEFYALLNPEN